MIELFAYTVPVILYFFCLMLIRFFGPDYGPMFKLFSIILYTPLSIVFFISFIWIYFELTYGPTSGSDDGRGIGSALMLIFAFPIILILNIALCFSKAKERPHESVAPQ